MTIIERAFVHNPANEGEQEKRLDDRYSLSDTTQWSNID